MKDGTEYKNFLAKPKGDPDNPLSFEELSEKYKTAAIRALSEKQIGALIDKIKILEKIENMNEIVALGVAQP
jgi:2-methylcitrate dehydratase PrpD